MPLFPQNSQGAASHIIRFVVTGCRSITTVNIDSYLNYIAGGKDITDAVSKGSEAFRVDPMTVVKGIAYNEISQSGIIETSR
jgi:hypothetical protein